MDPSLVLRQAGSLTSSSGSNASKASPAPPSDYVPIPDSVLLIFLITASILGLLILVNLPRHIARLISGIRAGELSKGLWFGDKGKRDSPLRQYAVGLEQKVSQNPRHFPSWGQILPGSVTLQKDISLTGGYTVGQLLTLAVYAGLVGAAIAIKNPLTEPKHVGQVATFQIPLGVLLGIPLSPIATLLGITTKQLNFLHRFVGRMIFAAATIHAGIFTNKFIEGGMLGAMLKKPKFIGAYVAWFSVLFMLLTSLPVVRKRLHGLFRICHLIGLACLVTGLAFHMPRTGLIGTIAAAIYGKDIILRLFKLRIKRAFLIPMPQCGSTQITVPAVTSGWRAGQYVHIRVPALRKMGGVSWVENHPFTIASADGGQLILVVRKRGDWTRALYDLSCENESGEKGEGIECKVLLEGPFGGPGATLIGSYSGVVLLAGGSGLTYAMGVFEDTIHKRLEGGSNCISISLIWMVKYQDESRPFIEHLKNLLRLAEERRLSAQVYIYVTRSDKTGSTTTGGIVVHHLKPSIATVVEASVERCKSNMAIGKRPSGVYIGVCGPRALVQDTTAAVGGIPWASKRSVGGINLHKEFYTV